MPKSAIIPTDDGGRLILWTCLNEGKCDGGLSCEAVKLVVTPAEMGRTTFAIEPHFAHEETRELAQQFGKHNAVKITVESPIDKGKCKYDPQCEGTGRYCWPQEKICDLCGRPSDDTDVISDDVDAPCACGPCRELCNYMNYVFKVLPSNQHDRVWNSFIKRPR